MPLSVGELDANIGQKYKQFGDIQREAQNNALAQKAAQMDLASKANIYKTQVLSAAAGSGNPDVINAAFQHLNQNGIDTSDVPTDLPSLVKYTDAARLAQSPLGSLLNAGLKAEGNLNQAAGLTGNTTTAGTVDPLSAAIASKVAGIGGQPAAQLGNTPAQQVANIPPVTSTPLTQSADQGYMDVNPPKAIDGAVPVVDIASTPTAGAPISTPQPTPNGKAQLTFQRPAQLPGETIPAYNARVNQEFEAFKASPEYKKQDTQAGETGKLAAENTNADAKAQQYLQRLNALFDGMDTINKSGDLPDGGFISPETKAALSRGFKGNGIGSGAVNNAVSQWTKLDADNLINEVQQFVATAGANTRLNQTLDRMVGAAKKINLDDTQQGRENSINIARALVNNQTIGADNLAGANKPYEAIPVKTSAQVVGNIPAAAANHLKQNPNLADDFDAKYGAGASKRILGK